MKCPKCHYLGFETGNRCKNCGYDFSLLALADAPPAGADLILRPEAARPDAVSRTGEGCGSAWRNEGDLDLHLELPGPPPARQVGTVSLTGNNETNSRAAAEPGLPLFAPTMAPEDAPLVKLPAAPRPPVAVRRTPEIHDQTGGTNRSQPRRGATALHGTAAGWPTHCRSPEHEVRHAGRSSRGVRTPAARRGCGDGRVPY